MGEVKGVDELGVRVACRGAREFLRLEFLFFDCEMIGTFSKSEGEGRNDQYMSGLYYVYYTKLSLSRSAGPSAGVAVGPDCKEALRSEWTFTSTKQDFGVTSNDNF